MTSCHNRSNWVIVQHTTSVKQEFLVQYYGEFDFVTGSTLVVNNLSKLDQSSLTIWGGLMRACCLIRFQYFYDFEFCFTHTCISPIFYKKKMYSKHFNYCF